MGSSALLRGAVGIARRAGYYFLLLVLANLIMYGLVNLAPGSPLESAYSTEAYEDDMGGALGLDRPFPVRFAVWFGRAITFDFGYSFKLQLGRPVAEMIGAPFAYTVLTVVLALALAFAASVFVSVVLKPDGPLGSTLRPLIVVLSAIPAFLLCYWTIQGVNYVVAGWVEQGTLARPDWFPLGQAEVGVVPYLFAALVLAIGDATLGDLLRGLDRELVTLSGRRYIHAARTRGASVVRHALPEFSVTAVGLFASRLVFLLGGVVIVEKLFSLSGAGAKLWEAAEARDYPVVAGVTFLSTLVVIAALFAADLYQFLRDPRITR